MRVISKIFSALIFIRKIFKLIFLFLFLTSFESNSNKPDKNSTVVKFYETKAALFYSQANFDSAIVYYKKASDYYLKNKIFGSYINKLLGISICYYNLNNIQKAEEQLKKIEQLKFHYSSDLLFEIKRVQGHILFAKNKYREGINLYHELIQNIPETKKKYLIHLNTSLGYAYHQIYYFDKAILYYLIAEKLILSERIEKYSDLVLIYQNTALLYQNLADYTKTETYLKKAIGIAKKIYGENNHQLSYLYHSLGSIYFEKNDFDAALKTYNLIFDLNKTPDDLGAVYKKIARCYEKKGQLKDAELYFQKSVSFWKTSNASPYEKSASSLLFGDFLASQNRDKEALSSYLLALNNAKQKLGDKHYITSKVFLAFGNLYLKQKKYLKALEYYQQALIANFETFDNENIYSNPENLKALSEIQTINILSRKAHCLEEIYKFASVQKNLEFSFQSYQSLVYSVSKLQKDLLMEEDKLFLNENTAPVFSNAIRVACELYFLTGKEYYFDNAFYFTECSKSTVLLNAINDQKAKCNLPKHIKEQEISLKKRIADYEKKLLDENKKSKPEKEKINNYESELFQLNKTNDTLIAFCKRKYPKYTQIKNNYKPINAAELQNSMQADDAILEYAVQDSIIYLFVLLKDKKECFVINRNKEFNAAVLSFIENLHPENSNRFSNTDFKNFTDAAYKLYEKLIQPAAKILVNKNLIFIPDDFLYQIPFEALITAPVKSKDNFNSVHWLLKKHTISYAYLATLLFHKEQKKQANEKILAFAPEYPASENKKLLAFQQRGYKLEALPWAKEEVKAIQSLLKGKNYTGEMATEKTFKNEAENYSVLHLAMHAIIDNENPDYSGLAFSTKNDKTEDGFLHIYELYNLDIRAELAVLSACNTGSGKIQKGEGVMSLARAFFYAGCPSVVLSLWAVDDNASAVIMKNFYKYLKKGLPKNKALQQAKLDFIQQAKCNHAHPYYWAPFIQAGNTDSILFISHSGINITVIICIAILILLAGGLLFRKRLRG